MRLDRMQLKRGIRYLLLSCMIITGLISVIAFGGCNDDGPGTGTLAITMGDSITDKVKEVWVYIEEVSVHESVDEENAGENQGNGDSEGEDSASWRTIKGDGIPGNYDLLTLRDAPFEELGEVTLEAGHYTQLRLKLRVNEGDNYVVPKVEQDTPEPTPIPLQISSQDETGIKLIKGFDIESGTVTELHLDWDLEKSIIEMPDGGYRLKPTIKILNVDVSSTLSGMVTEDDPNSDLPEVTIPVQDALVTATKITDAADADPPDVTTTFTGDDGGYMLVLEEGTYNIDVSKTGYVTASREVTIEYEVTDYTGEDFTLALTPP